MSDLIQHPELLVLLLFPLLVFLLLLVREWRARARRSPTLSSVSPSRLCRPRCLLRLLGSISDLPHNRNRGSRSDRANW